MEPENVQQNVQRSDPHLLAVLPSRDSADTLTDQLTQAGLGREAIHIDDPADVATISNSKSGAPTKRNTKGIVIGVSLIIGALVATPLAFVDFAPHYWVRFVLIFLVTFVVAGRALAVHFVFNRSDPESGTTVLRVDTNAAQIRDLLEKSDAVSIQEVTAPAPR